MKASKRIIVWILVSLSLQLSLYLFLDKYYFSDENNIKVTNLDNIVNNKEIKPNINFPEGVKDIALSYDKGYTSYFDSSNTLRVFETDTAKPVNIMFSKGAQCISYKWLPDTNRMILAETVSASKGKVVKFYSFDPETEDKEEIKDYNRNKVNSIPVSNSKPSVDIEFSTLTGVMYAKVASGGATGVYRIDRNEEMTKVNTAGRKVGDIKVSSHDDNLAYEDLTSNKIRTNVKLNSILSIKGSSTLYLLNADGDNNIYVGNSVSHKVNKIYYGKLSENTTEWKMTQLTNAVDPSKIIIANGVIYVNNEDENTLINVSTGKRISYKGNLIEVFDDMVASASDSKLVFNPIK
ncbi:MAG: hypothetical protein Q8936_09110 [Bacillota bacterium]|nr:hypothetical protein [Bacillota bacterium]